MSLLVFTVVIIQRGLFFCHCLPNMSANTMTLIKLSENQNSTLLIKNVLLVDVIFPRWLFTEMCETNERNKYHETKNLLPEINKIWFERLWQNWVLMLPCCQMIQNELVLSWEKLSQKTVKLKGVLTWNMEGIFQRRFQESFIHWASSHTSLHW